MMTPGPFIAVHSVRIVSQNANKQKGTRTGETRTRVEETSTRVEETSTRVEETSTRVEETRKPITTSRRLPMRRTRWLGFAVSIAAAALLGLLAAAPAQATILTLQITSDHCTGGCLGGLTSLGTVTVNDAGGNLAFSIDLTSSNSGIVKTGFDGSFAFNLVNNNVITYSAITATGGAAFTPVG